MKLPDWLRLTLISIALLAAQQALLLSRPEWRTGLDFYLIWLLAVSAVRGFSAGFVLALLGGMWLDAPSAFGAFHLLFYLIPVCVGALLSSSIIVEYSLLAMLISGILVVTKLISLMVIAWTAGWISGPGYLFQLNYWPLLLLCGLVFVFWQRFVGLVPRMATSGR